MNYSSSTYARAFAESLAEAQGKKNVTQSVMADNFLAMIRRNGDEARLGKILEETERLLRQKDGTRTLIVESARALDASARSMIKEMAQHGDRIEERIVPGLIAGIRITANDESQFDGSLKNKLDKIFGMV